MRSCILAVACLLSATLSVIAGETTKIPDADVKKTFLRDCRALSRAVPDLALPCTDFEKGKSPATLRIYLGFIDTAKRQFRTQGPEIAKSVMKDCMVNAAGQKPDLGGLLFCIRLRRKGSDLEKLAKGQGDWADYAKLANRVAAPIPSYPADTTADGEKQRAAVRKAAVYACAAKGDGYIRTLCTAVAAHEAFANRPFGDNGELAKAFDSLLKIYAITEAPKQVIQEEVKESLERAGFNDQVAEAVANPQQGAEEGVKHLANEGQKLIDKAKCLFGGC